ncbi:hypothetical protein Tco_0337211 [Tanacetum coccineum]
MSGISHSLQSLGENRTGHSKRIETDISASRRQLSTVLFSLRTSYQLLPKNELQEVLLKVSLHPHIQASEIRCHARNAVFHVHLENSGSIGVQHMPKYPDSFHFLATGAKDSSKSIPSSWRYPLTTRRDLFRMTVFSSSCLFLNNHFNGRSIASFEILGFLKLTMVLRYMTCHIGSKFDSLSKRTDEGSRFHLFQRAILSHIETHEWMNLLVVGLLVSAVVVVPVGDEELEVLSIRSSSWSKKDG